MRLISLNTWGGIVFDPLLAWITQQASITDIFCFQEVLFGTVPEFSKKNLKARLNLFSEIAAQLTDYAGFSYPAKRGSYFGGVPLPNGVDVGEAMFIKRSVPVTNSGGFRTYADDGPIAHDLSLTVCGNVQCVTVHHTQEILLSNIHGLWQEATKKQDTSERMQQSQKILNFFRTQSNPKILCGDYNLMPETESLLMLERSGLRNLIKDFHITDTRGTFYTKEQRFADYVLVSPDINVRSFTVPNILISDHLPMILDFD